MLRYKVLSFTLAAGILVEHGTVQPSGRSFGVEPGEAILAAGIRAGIGLPYGCRDGACGACKGKVLSGEVYQGDYQRNAMTEAEQAAGYALFCCALPLTDLVIECREVTGKDGIKPALGAIKALNGADCDGRALRVNEAQGRPEGGGGGGGGGRREGGYGGGGRRESRW